MKEFKRSTHKGKKTPEVLEQEIFSLINQYHKNFTLNETRNFFFTLNETIIEYVDLQTGTKTITDILNELEMGSHDQKEFKALLSEWQQEFNKKN